MPYQFHINKQHRLCYVVVYGKVDGEQIVEAISSIMADPDWRTGYDTLWDGTSIQKAEIRPGSIRRVTRTANDFSALLGAGKSAYVATRKVDVLAAWLLKLSIQIPGRQVGVFQSLREAREWLGLGSAALPGAPQAAWQ